MRAVYITGKETLEVCEEPRPEPSPGQVRIRIEYVGICGSDLHYYFYGENSGFSIDQPLIPGHELAGRVDHDPEAKWRRGQPVTVHPARYGIKQVAYEGSPQLWPGGSYLGSASTWPHTQGALVEYMLVDSQMLRALPEGLSTRRASLAEPLAVVLHGIHLAGGVVGARVLVAGSGPIGLLAAAGARAMGAGEITATDVLTGPLQLAARLGADTVVNVAETTLEANAYDVILECSGTSLSINTALEAVRPRGTAVQIGMVSSSTSGISLSALVTKELRLLGAFRFNVEFDHAIRLLAERPEIEAVIAHDFPLEQIQQGFTTAIDPGCPGKVLVCMTP